MNHFCLIRTSRWAESQISREEARGRHHFPRTEGKSTEGDSAALDRRARLRGFLFYFYFILGAHFIFYFMRRSFLTHYVYDDTK
jgi:hypothetical protein